MRHTLRTWRLGGAGFIFSTGLLCLMPTLGAPTPEGPAPSQAVLSPTHPLPHLLSLETAREIDLDGLAGLGPAMTRRILSERERQPFTHWADLQRRVKGLGPHLAQRLSEQGLRVQGKSWPDKSAP